MPIEETQNAVLAGESDCIYNRFRDFNQGKCSFLRFIGKTGNACTIPLLIIGKEARLGLWLSPVQEEAAIEAVEYVFRTYRKIKVVRFQHYLKPLRVPGRARDVQRQNHWSIMFPKTAEELIGRLGAKKRYNIKREKRIANDQLGSYEIHEHCAETVPQEIVECYFAFKQKTHGIDYRMSPGEYLQRYHVSHLYVLRFPSSREIGAIICSCEQGCNVYLENLAYDPALEKYSLGAILYDEYLRILVRKGKRSLYLGHGHQVYKTHYGAKEDTTWSGSIFRTRLDAFLLDTLPNLCWTAKQMAKHCVRPFRRNKGNAKT